MWHPLTHQTQVDQFMDAVNGFHDCALKELKFGGDHFVGPDLSFHSATRNFLRVIFQRQSTETPCIEIVFRELQCFWIRPDFQEPMFEAAMFYQDDWLYWTDSCRRASMAEHTTIKSKRAFWRETPHWLGRREIYSGVVPDDLGYYDPQDFAVDYLHGLKTIIGPPR